MSSGVPWILVALAVTLLVTILLIIMIWRRQRSVFTETFSTIHKTAFFVQFSVGLICALGGAYIMFTGDLLGENTTGIARIIGIIGICLIATATPIGLVVKRKISR